MLELLKNREEYEFVQHQFPAVETQQPFLFAELAAASDHVLLAHEPPLRHWIETGQLATARLEDLGETWDVQLIQRKDRKLSAAGIELAAAIREASGKYIG
ncbi:MAG: hypothetical protein ISP91_13620 [Pseudomonadales bacterium]|nr:hypothetical protein [Pseudomonadales bacterium]